LERLEERERERGGNEEEMRAEKLNSLSP